MWWSSNKFKIGVGLVVIVVLIIIILLVASKWSLLRIIIILIIYYKSSMAFDLKQLHMHALEEQDEQGSVEDSWHSVLIDSEDNTKVDNNRI